MNYDGSRQGALLRIADMARAFEECGIKLRDDYTLDDAIEFSGRRVVELSEEGYPAMLSVLGSRSSTGRSVSDALIFLPRVTAITTQNLKRVIRELVRLTGCDPHISHISIKYTVENYKRKKLLSANSVLADVSFTMPDAPVEWRIPSAEPVDPALIPNIGSANKNDTLINSPSAEWQIEVSSVMLLSLLSECFMRAGSEKKLYFYETDSGSYVTALSASSLYAIKQNLKLDFFPVPDPDYDDELYEREALAAQTADMDSLTAKADESNDADESDKYSDIDDYTAFDSDFLDELDDMLEADTEGLPVIAAAPVSDEAELTDDDESAQLDPELMEQLRAQSEVSGFDFGALSGGLGYALRRAVMTPRQRSELRTREYNEVRDRLIQLAQRGLRMNSGFVLRDVLSSEGIKPARLSRKGWEGLLWFLCGVDKRDGETTAYSDDILLYSYRDGTAQALLPELTRQIQRMTRGQLHFGSMRQFNDYRGKPLAFEFVQGGKPHRWEFRAYSRDDRLSEYFENMARLMRDNGCSGNLWYLERRGCCYYMYVTQKNGLRLRRLTDLPLQAVLDLSRE